MFPDLSRPKPRGILASWLNTCIASALTAATSGPMAWGQTALETEVQQRQAPHRQMSAPPKVRTHWATQIHYRTGASPYTNDEVLADLKARMARCAREKQANHQPVRVPTEWPQWVSGTREDFYATAHYAIRYHSGWAYDMTEPDCSLAVTKWATAELTSSAGLCRIDLQQRSARGTCDFTQHEHAKPLVASWTQPGLPSRQINGLRCQEQLNPVGLQNCVAIGGSFVPAKPVLLERGQPGMKWHSTQAELDLEVSLQVFKPHLQGGFEINSPQR